MKIILDECSFDDSMCNDGFVSIDIEGKIATESVDELYRAICAMKATHTIQEK
jgi:hypothetical protein